MQQTECPQMVNGRRDFTVMLYVIAVFLMGSSLSAAAKPLIDSVELSTVSSGWDGKKCWVHSRAGVIPARSPGNPSHTPLVVLTTQKLRITGSDIFDGLHEFRTNDLGTSWVGPVSHVSLDRRSMLDNLEAAPCDFTPQWHVKTGTLLGTGKTFGIGMMNILRGHPVTLSILFTNRRARRGRPGLVSIFPMFHGSRTVPQDAPSVVISRTVMFSCQSIFVQRQPTNITESPCCAASMTGAA